MHIESRTVLNAMTSNSAMVARQSQSTFSVDRPSRPVVGMQGLVAVMMVTLLSGCGDLLPSRPPLGPPKKSNVEQAQIDAQAATIEEPEAPFKGDWESWYAYYLNRKQVGYSHIKATQVSNELAGNDQVVRFSTEDQVRFRQGNSNFVQHLRQNCVETIKGHLVSFDSELQVGPVATEYHGSVEGRQLVIETTRGTARTVDKVQWDSSFRGMVAVEQSLRRNPMSEGDRRTLMMLLPIKHKMASVELICAGSASIALLDGTYQELTEIVSHEKLDGKKVSEQVLWVNENGEIQKSLRPGVNLVAYRTDEQTALESVVDPSDVIASTTIDVTGSMDRPEEATKAGFLVSPSLSVVRARGQISIPTGPGQFVQLKEHGTHQVFVDPQLPEPPTGFVGRELSTEPADLASNAMIDSNAPLIRRIATAAVSPGMTKREEVDRMLATTSQLLARKESLRGITKASIVANQAEGNVTDHAVFLAALLRSRGIPARLAFGLVYVPGDRPQMRYHVWTLAYVDDKWLSLDGTLGKPSSADRIMLATSNLGGGNEYRVVSQVLASLGRMNVQIKGVVH